MPQRVLSEAEFTGIRDRLIAQAPDGLSEEQFNRWLGPRLDGAIAEAEQLPPALEGSSLGRFVGSAASMLNPVAAASGVFNAVRHPVQTAQAIGSAHADQFAKGQARVSEGFAHGRLAPMVEGAGHFLAAALPVIGPVAAATGEQIASGDVSGGLGGGAGLLVGGAVAGPAVRAAGKVVKPLAQAGARRMYQAALKPTRTTLKDVRAPGGLAGQRRALLETGLKEGIPVSKAGAAKAEALIDALNQQVTAALDDAAARGATVDPVAVERTIRSVAADFANQINAQPELAAIANVADNFSMNPNVAQGAMNLGRPVAIPKAGIPVKTAQEMKVNTYKGLRGKYGRELGGTIEAEKAGARALKEGIETAAPEVSALNAREAALFPLEEALAEAMVRRGNYNIVGLTPTIAAIPAATGHSILPLLATLADRSPALMSRAAIAMHRAGTTGKVAQRGGQGLIVGSGVTSAREPRRTTGSAPLVPVLAGP
jgi:hypothetical protein